MRQMHMLLAAGVIVLTAATTATVAFAADATSNAIAQSGGLTDTLVGATPTGVRPSATTAATPTPTTAPSASPAPTAAPSAALTLTVPLTLPSAITDTASLSTTDLLTDGAATNFAPAPEGAVAGTVIANRTTALVRFFAEGNTYDLAGLRSAGLALSRPSNVLNLYNCDASLGMEKAGCYWDPYLLERDGFYEIVAGKDAGALQSLILREAGTPPENQVWIQNRVGRDEDVYFGTQMRTLPVGAVEQFALDGDDLGVFYLRSCVTTTDNASVCEWGSHSAEPGGYYALVELSRPGGVAGTTISTLSLQAVLGALPEEAAGDPATSAAAAGAAPQTICTLAVPALNVRSGPGLGFDIVKKVRSTESTIATIIVTGRTSAGDRLRVDETIAPGGWVIAGAEYLTCEGDVTLLPAIAESELPATPTPLPVEIVTVDVPPADIGPAAPVEGVDSGATAIGATDAITATESTPEQTSAVLPPGTALLTVHNAFDRDVRFTLDQRYRLEPGPSEFDLLPGGSTSIIVYGGAVPFTASSPWQGLSGNTTIPLAEGELRDVYLIFYYDEADERWFLAPIEGEIGKS